MKFVAFIMAVLILALPVLPCADDASATDTDKAKTEIVKQNSHSEEQEHNDTCSPFCHCSCCAGFSISRPLPVTSSSILFDIKLYLSYLPDNLIDFSPPIWQPPQLS